MFCKAPVTIIDALSIIIAGFMAQVAALSPSAHCDGTRARTGLQPQTHAILSPHETEMMLTFVPTLLPMCDYMLS